MENYYVNFRCRKCGIYLSAETSDINDYYGLKGILVSKKRHICSQGIGDDEKIFCDLISYSKEKPLGEIIHDQLS